MDYRKEDVNLILKRYSKMAEPVMKKLLVLNVDRRFQKLVKYQIETGGKRLRSALAIISCQLFGGKIKDVLLPAAGLETLHNYTLIVDDIIDNSILRRGKPTTWFKFGSSIAQCIAMDYGATVFQIANLSRKPEQLSDLFAKALKAIVDGEILDILFEQEGREKEPYIVKNRYSKISENDYFRMVDRKTAFFTQSCCEVGGIITGSKKEEILALRNYGFNLGVAFQIQDDILDIFGEEQRFGKEIGKDIMERKGGNIVILLALKELNAKGKKKLLGILRKKQINQRDIKTATSLIRKTNSRQKAVLLGQNFIKKAKKALRKLPQNKWNKLLTALADFVIGREK